MCVRLFCTPQVPRFTRSSCFTPCLRSTRVCLCVRAAQISHSAVQATRLTTLQPFRPPFFPPQVVAVTSASQAQMQHAVDDVTGKHHLMKLLQQPIPPMPEK
jgi:hypothetical protein